ncbi:MAG: YihY family inner membrane protein [Marinagarivorans sp.]|nr:YihY family inner membrane protein [Marinagarivorans sp.]
MITHKDRLEKLWLGMKIFTSSLYHDFKSAGCQKSAAALTYMTLFALVPLLMVFYSVFSLVPAFDGLSSQLQGAIFANLLPASSQSLQTYLQNFSQQARNLTLPGVGMLLITAVLMLTNIEKNFNTIWGVTQPRRGFIKYLRYWAVLSIGPILLAITLAMSTYLLSLKLFFNEYDVIGVIPILFRFLPIFIMTLVFALLFTTVPNCHVPIKYAFIGGGVTAICFELLKMLFAKFVATTSFELVYGAFAVVPLFLIWLNALWTIVLSGAILVRTLSERNYVHLEGRKTDLFLAVECLALFYRCHQEGRVVRDKDCYRLGVGVVHWQKLREALLSGRWIVETHTGDYTFIRSFESVTLWDLTLLLGTPIGDLPKKLQKLPHAPWVTVFMVHRQQAAEASQKALTLKLSELFARSAVA